jgi:8-oxo-dGTP pyrophosphatase MutT (NUDIX family)
MATGMEPMTTFPLQASAVPFRRRRGRLEFCLITTSRGNWIFPKGIVDPGETCVETALKEAFEEAGLHGRIVGDPLGAFELAKFGKTFEVVTLLMEVQRCDTRWMEQQMRQRRWVVADEARLLLKSPHLCELLDEAVERLKA